MFQKLMIRLALKALCDFLGICLHSDDCPDGVCEEAIADLKAIERKVDADNLNVSSVGSPWEFARCLDIPRFVNWIKEGIAIFQDAKICVDGDDNVITLGAAPDPAE